MSSTRPRRAHRSPVDRVTVLAPDGGGCAWSHTPSSSLTCPERAGQLTPANGCGPTDAVGGVGHVPHVAVFVPGSSGQAAGTVIATC